MARNEEKAQSMLNRFITMKKEEQKKPKARRPYLASECRDLADADKRRQQIMREIGRKVYEIQNELGEHRIRDLNDEISKLIREKGHWEKRIDGQNYPAGRGPGYRYFGAARKLPGVKELLEKPPEPRKRKNRYDIYKRIDASYYGYRDDEDETLVKPEKPAEEMMQAEAVKKWLHVEKKKKAGETVKSGEFVEEGFARQLLREEEEDVVEEGARQ